MSVVATTESSQSISVEKANIHALASTERAALYRSEYQGKSRFQKEFGADAVDLDIGEYGQIFRAELLRLLASKQTIRGDEPLESLHLHLEQEMKDYNFNDGVNKITTLLYDTDDEFSSTYLGFIKNILGPLFPYPFLFQATPTIRIHCPKGKNSDHYPRYHTDIGYGHPPQEINLWIPLTAPQPPQQHGFRRMSHHDSAVLLDSFGYDFAPFIDRAIKNKDFNQSLNTKSPQVSTPFGKIHAFDSRCIHTGEPLESHTRASIDIRIIPLEDFARLPVEYQGTGRRRILYKPGECYHSVTSDNL